MPDTAANPSQPSDLAALPDGGLLVLDQIHKLVWHLDRTFRPTQYSNEPKFSELDFQPKRGTPRQERSTPAIATPIKLDAGDGEIQPIAIAALPDGSFWVLDNRPVQEGKLVSTLWRYSIDESFAPQSVQLIIENLVDDKSDVLDLKPICAYDLAYVPNQTDQGDALDSGRLFLVDFSGEQAYRLKVDLSQGLKLRLVPEYYPLRRFSGAALVSAAGEVYYQQGKRWLSLKALPLAIYEPHATLTLPIFDGRDPNCIWHRLCLDAYIPPDTAVQVATRAANSKAELALQSFREQPKPYHRPTGSELPYYSLWQDDELSNAHTGTWELLFQQTIGRYMELRLTLVGNERTTPRLRALRAHYPRFSYLKQYLPPIYQQDADSRQFVENFLANPEGIFTTIEGLIAQVQTLFDVRAVRTKRLIGWAVGLDWLLILFWTERLSSHLEKKEYET